MGGGGGGDVWTCLIWWGMGTGGGLFWVGWGAPMPHKMGERRGLKKKVVPKKGGGGERDVWT